MAQNENELNPQQSQSQALGNWVLGLHVDVEENDTSKTGGHAFISLLDPTGQDEIVMGMYPDDRGANMVSKSMGVRGKLLEDYSYLERNGDNVYSQTWNISPEQAALVMQKINKERQIARLQAQPDPPNPTLGQRIANRWRSFTQGVRRASSDRAINRAVRNGGNREQLIKERDKRERLKNPDISGMSMQAIKNLGDRDNFDFYSWSLRDQAILLYNTGDLDIDPAQVQNWDKPMTDPVGKDLNQAVNKRLKEGGFKYGRMVGPLSGGPDYNLKSRSCAGWALSVVEETQKLRSDSKLDKDLNPAAKPNDPKLSNNELKAKHTKIKWKGFRNFFGYALPTRMKNKLTKRNYAQEYSARKQRRLAQERDISKRNDEEKAFEYGPKPQEQALTPQQVSNNKLASLQNYLDPEKRRFSRVYQEVDQDVNLGGAKTKLFEIINGRLNADPPVAPGTPFTREELQGFDEIDLRMMTEAGFYMEAPPLPVPEVAPPVNDPNVVGQNNDNVPLPPAPPAPPVPQVDEMQQQVRQLSPQEISNGKLAELQNFIDPNNPMRSSQVWNDMNLEPDMAFAKNSLMDIMKQRIDDGVAAGTPFTTEELAKFDSLDVPSMKNFGFVMDQQQPEIPVPPVPPVNDPNPVSQNNDNVPPPPVPPVPPGAQLNDSNLVNQVDGNVPEAPPPPAFSDQNEVAYEPGQLPPQPQLNEENVTPGQLPSLDDIEQMYGDNLPDQPQVDAEKVTPGYVPSVDEIEAGWGSEGVEQINNGNDAAPPPPAPPVPNENQKDGVVQTGQEYQKLQDDIHPPPIPPVPDENQVEGEVQTVQGQQDDNNDVKPPPIPAVPEHDKVEHGKQLKEVFEKRLEEQQLENIAVPGTPNDDNPKGPPPIPPVPEHAKLEHENEVRDNLVKAMQLKQKTPNDAALPEHANDDTLKGLPTSDNDKIEHEHEVRENLERAMKLKQETRKDMALPDKDTPGRVTDDKAENKIPPPPPPPPPSSNIDMD